LKKPITTEIRDDGSVIISGYVNAVERDSRLLHDAKHGDFYERVAEGAFGAALRRAENEIELKLNHGRVIGKRGENLMLDEDSIGLRASAAVTDPETVEAARAGRLTGWSFRFYVRAAEGAVGERGNYPRRFPFISFPFQFYYLDLFYQRGQPVRCDSAAHLGSADLSGCGADVHGGRFVCRHFSQD